jgi:hypothetical protein
MQLLASLQQPLVTPVGQPARRSCLRVWRVDEERTSGFVDFQADWVDGVYRKCRMELDVNLENDRATRPLHICIFKQEEEGAPIEYRFQKYMKDGRPDGDTDESTKVLKEGRTSDDVWKVIAMAMEDICSPGHYPLVRIQGSSDASPIIGSLSMEDRLAPLAL